MEPIKLCFTGEMPIGIANVGFIGSGPGLNWYVSFHPEGYWALEEDIIWSAIHTKVSSYPDALYSHPRWGIRVRDDTMLARILMLYCEISPNMCLLDFIAQTLDAESPEVSK